LLNYYNKENQKTENIILEEEKKEEKKEEKQKLKQLKKVAEE